MRFVAVAAGVVADSEDAEASLRDVLEASQELTRLAGELRVDNARLRAENAGQAAEMERLRADLAVLHWIVFGRSSERSRREDIEPRNVIAFTFTEKVAAELRERVTNLVTQTFGNVIGLAELFIGTMHGYALDALQTHVLDEIQTRLLIERHSRESGLTLTEAMVKGNAKKLRRYADSRPYMEVTNILREDEVDGQLLPASLISNRDAYRALLHKYRYFDYTPAARDRSGPAG
jgi:hypothetical protein